VADVRRVADGRVALRRPTPEARVVGRSAAMRRVRARIAGLGPLQVPVLVVGERGSGRDWVVNALHGASQDRASTLLALRGDASAAGRAPASARAVYLDEVGALSPEAQRHWLERVDGKGRVPGDRVRLYASTSEDLASRARDGSFLPKLAGRLLRFRIELPPLRDRLEDVPVLVAALVPKLGARLGRASVRVLPAALARLAQHPWAENVRELEDALERMIAFSADGQVTRSHVDEALASDPESVVSLRGRRESRQRDELVRLLEACGGNLAEVARRLGMSRSAIVYRTRKYGLLPRAKLR
jgi:two-component system response regulator AtoC